MKLIRATWSVSIDQETILPRTYGFALVQELHSRMKLALGDAEVPNVTCAGLIGKTKSVEDFVVLEPETEYRLVLSGLNDVAVQAIKTLDLTDTLELLGAKFHLVRQPDDVSSYEELYEAAVLTEPVPRPLHELRFLTPTAFSQNRRYLPLPLPRLLFRSWLERWNHFAPVYLGGDELLDYLDSAVALQHLRIQTRQITVQQARIPGFVGNVSLRLFLKEPLLANVAELLLAYSRFCGTGIKTRLGMGTTEYTISENRSVLDTNSS
jgi:CRISPR-associated endoribonuclease Cas6